jgi:hypothetical protein
MRESGRYPLCGVGDINTFAVFSELNRAVLAPTGRAAFIVPSGLATDATTSGFFADLIEHGSLVSFYEFENDGFFAGIGQGHMVRFAITSLTGQGRDSRLADFVFQAKTVAALSDKERHFVLHPDELSLLSPNTRTAPIFQGGTDAELNKHIYRRTGVLWAEREPSGNPWSLSFTTIFHMTNDAHLFHTRSEMQAAGQTLSASVWTGPAGKFLPLIEAKMIHAFNHRYADYSTAGGDSRLHILPPSSTAALTDPNFSALPFYWVSERDVFDALKTNTLPPWALGWRGISDSRASARCIVPCVIPMHGVGNSLPLAFSKGQRSDLICLYAVLTSWALDYAARQKVGGLNVNYHILKQLPVFPPSQLQQAAPWDGTRAIADWLLPRVVELTYTAWDLEPFGVDCGYAGPPFVWDEERRFLLRAELDAAFFHLYLGTPSEWSAGASDALKSKLPTPRDAVSHILETFPIVKKKDLESFGTFRTKDTILDIYDSLTTAITTSTPYQTTLSLPPADPSCRHTACTRTR